MLYSLKWCLKTNYLYKLHQADYKLKIQGIFQAVPMKNLQFIKESQASNEENFRGFARTQGNWKGVTLYSQEYLLLEWGSTLYFFFGISALRIF